MDQGGNFRPGRPQNPYFGYSTRARSTDYPIAVNTNIQGRAAWGRISFDVLKAIYDAYDVARMCVNHKVDQIRSMKPMFLPADGVKEDIDDEIDAARLVLKKPDRELPYGSWISKWLENAVKYDSAPLYRRRDYNGDVIGLEVVDGKTIFPYIDQNGRRPVAEPGKPQPPAYAQIIKGMVGTWFTVEDIEYVPFRPQEDSPYGMAPMESLLLSANTDLRFQWHFLQMFTDGSMPAGFMELPPDISSPSQVEEWQDYWDAMVMGDQAKLTQLIAVPAGSKFTETKPRAFDKTFPEYLMSRVCAGHGVLPQNLGLIEDVNRSTGEVQDEIQFRINTLPWVEWVEGHLTRYLQDDIGLRVKVELDTGRDKEDRLTEAQAHQIYVEIGAESPDEVRSDVLGKPIDKERPTPRSMLVQRVGPIPLFALEGVSGRTDPETFGPAKDQPILDQPFVPPVGVVATQGTSDEQAVLQAADNYQQYVRRTLQNEGDPNRETADEKTARGKKAMADQQAAAEAEGVSQVPGAAPIEGDVQPKPKVKPQAPKTAPVAKSLEGEEAGELLAFRSFVAVRKRRGTWDRDFAFRHVSPAIARQLNAGGRAEVIKAASKPQAMTDADPVARKVYNQLLADFPPEAIEWVLHQQWTPEQLDEDAIDWDHVHSWTATHEPGKVRKLAKKMAKGGANRRAIAIDRPGKPTVMLADGHHHAEAHKLLGEDVPAFVAHVARVKGPWDEMHASQDPDADVMKSSGTPGLTKRSGMISLDLEPGTLPVAPGGVDDHHITIVYLGPDVDDDALANALARAGAAAAAMTGPISGTIGGVDTFPPSSGSDGMTPAFAKVELRGAHDLRAHLADLSASEHTDYHPHVTLKYLREGEQPPAPVTPTPVTFTHLSVHRGGKTVARIPLGPQPVVKAGEPDPKADGQSTVDWPGWRYDLAAAAYWAPRLAIALAGALDLAEIARAWLDGHRDKHDAADLAGLAATAIGWLAIYRQQLVGALTPLVAEIETDGYAIGTAAAKALLTGTDMVLGEWEPGSTEQAEQIILDDGDAAGLRNLFAAAQEAIGLMADSRIEAIGRLLAQAVLRGDSHDTLGAALRAYLADPERARRLALDQIARGSGAAAIAVYARNSVATHMWITAGDQRVCVICQTNEDQGPVPIGMPFLSGDLGPPGHPGGCRCATVPGPTHGR